MEERRYPINIVNIYSSCVNVIKRRMWEELIRRRSGSSIDHWCPIGDFNSVCGLHQRKSDNTHPHGGHNREFNEFILDMNVEDIPFVGRKFTWFHPNGRTMNVFDKGLTSREWVDKWQGSSLVVLDRNFSNHCPNILKSSIQDWGQKPFRVFDYWLGSPTLEVFVEEA